MPRLGVLCAAIVLLIPSLVIAQVRRAGLGPYVTLRPRDKVEVLGLPSVQKELKLTDDQKAAIAKLTDRFRGDQQRLREGAFDGLRQLGDAPTPEAKAALNAEFRAAGEALERDSDKALAKVLDRKQKARLDQIHVRAEGPMAFIRPDVQKRLNLSATQIESIGAILDEGRAELRRGMDAASQVVSDSSTQIPGQPSGKIDPTRVEAVKAAVERARTGGLRALESMDRSIAKLLTKKQRAVYEKMLGEPFGLEGFWPAPKAASPEPKEKPAAEGSEAEAKPK